MQVFMFRRRNGKPLIKMLQEVNKESVAGIDVTDASHAKLLHQPVLQRSVGTFHTALRLAGVRTEDLEGHPSRGLGSTTSLGFYDSISLVQTVRALVA